MNKVVVGKIETDSGMGLGGNCISVLQLGSVLPNFVDVNTIWFEGTSPARVHQTNRGFRLPDMGL